ncbi:DUF5806 family protein [Haladaptatus sp. NG-WS-4]
MSNDPSPPEPDSEDTRDAPDASSDDATDTETPNPDDTPNVDDTSPDPERGPNGPDSKAEAREIESDTASPSADAPEGTPDASEPTQSETAPEIPPDVQKYARFKKMDGAQYERVNEFLRDRTYITAREWAIARLCADFRTETGVEMTKIGSNLPYLVPFMTDTYTPQAVNQARSAFEEKVRKAGATFLYGAMSGFFTAEELDDVMYEVTEVAKFLLEVEGVDLSVDEELAAEDRISNVMREVRESSEQLRHDEVECPHCGREIGDES